MFVWLWVTLAIVVLDQVSKQYMSQLLALCEPGNCPSIEILPVFRFTVLHNTGAAFSFLDDMGGWQRWLFTAVSAVVSGVLLVWLYRLDARDKWLALALVLVLGGAIGNLVDRVRWGYVVDFIVVHYQNYYFPAFNVADSAITIGACVMILDMLFAAPTEPADGAVE